MIRFLLLSRFMWRVYAVFIAGYLLYAAWPMFAFTRPGVLFKTHAVALVNNAEARPCGGFITAVGQARLFPPKVSIQNVYTLPDTSLGVVHPRLAGINNDKKIWDTGTSPNPTRCAADVLEAYNTVAKTDLDRIWIIQISVLEEFVNLLGVVDLGDKKIASERFFASVTQKAADIDRHNIDSLNTRKSFLRPLMRSLIWQAIIRPHKWASLTRAFATAFDSGDLISLPLSKTDEEAYKKGFGLVEWNTGGAKSSRYLRKKLKIVAREIEPKEWEVLVDAAATHTGMYDEPLSQNWNGGFELHVPDFLEENPQYFEATLKPGESFLERRIYPYKGNLDDEDFAIWRGIGQDLETEIQITGYPQQFITSDSGQARENTIRWQGKLQNLYQKYSWDMTEDILGPFVTLHEIIDPRNLPPILTEKFQRPDLVVVELHFNEAIVLKNDFSAKLSRIVNENQKQTAFETTEIAQVRERTLILGFPREFAPAESPYAIAVSGVSDKWGNELETAPRTVIDRVGRVPEPERKIERETEASSYGN